MSCFSSSRPCGRRKYPPLSRNPWGMRPLLRKRVHGNAEVPAEQNSVGGKVKLRPREDDGGAAIRPELPWSIVWDRRMASRGFESRKRRVLVCVPICSVQDCCLECVPDCGVRRRSRIHELRGSTFGPTAVFYAVNSAGWSGKVKCALSRK
jgi:hypothetical protein